MPDFISDGCTLWFDGAWRDCCVEHDLAYYIGAVTMQTHIDLGVCIAQTTGGSFMGLLMLIGTAGWWIVMHSWRRKKPPADTDPKPGH